MRHVQEQDRTIRRLLSHEYIERNARLRIKNRYYLLYPGCFATVTAWNTRRFTPHRDNRRKEPVMFSGSDLELVWEVENASLTRQMIARERLRLARAARCARCGCHPLYEKISRAVLRLAVRFHYWSTPESRRSAIQSPAGQSINSSSC
jgi:hypothetical protein